VRSRNLLLATIALLAVALPPAAAAPSPEALRQALGRVLADPRLQGVDLGVCVQDLSGTALYERGADLALMPASNMKLVTAATVLRTWGDGYAFPTAIYADAKPDTRGAVVGNLYLKGLAHPVLDRGFIVRAAQRLCREGLRAITGTVICAGPVTCEPHRDPKRRDAEALFTALNKQGVVINHPAQAGEIPTAATLLHRWESETTGELLRSMNKRSDNAIADGFAQSLRYQHAAAGSYDSFVQDAWRPLGLPLAGCRFVDGSGLSRQNRLTPRFLAGLLQAAYRDELLRPNFLEALPVAGVDGTLRLRMQGTCAAGTVRAKTGFLTGACTLSGYVSGNGTVLCFAIMMNNHRDGATPMRDIQNRACVAMAEWLSGGP
jgi:D-alanyl-D-alanine carboxypeptidase/D-alanyl-D-alanine-endopeptidase (penicillin-binding protein 4)